MARASPEQICATHPDLGISKSTVYEWVDRRLRRDEQRMDLRRRSATGQGATPAAAAGRRGTPRAGRTTPSRPCRRTCAKARGRRARSSEGGPTRGASSPSTTAHELPAGHTHGVPDLRGGALGLRLVDAALGSGDAVRRVFGVVLTDNGGEFSDEGAVAGALGEREGETRLYPTAAAPTRRGCERNPLRDGEDAAEVPGGSRSTRSGTPTARS